MPDASRPPSVNALMRAAELENFPEALRARAARHAIENSRKTKNFEMPQLVVAAVAFALNEDSLGLPTAINASGVILHTGLGRARLHPAAIEAIRIATESHCAVELDLDSGNRGDRQSLMRELLCELTGAEDALVVNNCAGALVLALAATSLNKQVVLSRGEMVEIGGAFRMPDIIAASGCQLVEVGCTNKTKLADYERAITNETAAILRCHPSNYKIVGFTSMPTLAELSVLAKKSGKFLIDDNGSGCIIDTQAISLPVQPRMQDALVAGADLVIASGDKLLGGPQSGIILGNKSLIGKLRTHPLARALRVDKCTVAGLVATLKLYRDGAWREIPVWRYASRSLEDIEKLAHEIKNGLGAIVSVEPGATEFGGGSFSGSSLPTLRIGIPTSGTCDISQKLRLSRPAIIGRTEHGQFWLDPRTIEAYEIPTIIDALKQCCASGI